MKDCGNREERRERRRKIRQEKREKTIQEVKSAPVLSAVYFFLRVAVIAVMCLQILNGDYYNVAMCALTLILFTIPSIIERRLKIDVPNMLEGIVLVFIFAAEILGEINSFYLKYTFWDTALHTTTGFLSAAVGYSLVDILNKNSKNINLSPFYVAFFAFCFSMTVAVMWEFIEFFMDYFFLTDMQKDTILHTISTVELDPTKSNRAVVIRNITDVTVNGMPLGLGGYLDIGLYDTMKDMGVTFIGSLVFSIFWALYTLGKIKGWFILRLIPKRMEEEKKDDPEKLGDGK